MSSHTLNPAMPVMIRPDGVVQAGWDPRRAMLVHPPDGLSTTALADLLRGMQCGVAESELLALAVNRGIVDATAITDLVASLVEAGLATTRPVHPGRPPSASTAVAHYRTFWRARCDVRAPESGRAGSPTPPSPLGRPTSWCCRTFSSPTPGCYATFIRGGYLICRCACATEPAWSDLSFCLA